MKNIIFKRVVFIILVCFVKFTLAQDSSQFPVPGGNPNQLFYIQHSPNANTYVYELNLKNGQPDSSKPVHVFEIHYADKSQKTELSSIQWKFAYGISSKRISTDHYEIRFLSHKDYVLHLIKNADDKFYLYALINQKPAILSHVYLQINGGTFWSPNIEYVRLFGIDPATRAPVSAKLKVEVK
jgi:Domain of unknown function (DUF4833)